MPRVVALYRYPVKGFTAEGCEALTILDDGRVAGDRVLGFRFADAKAPDDEWSNKYECVVLANTPGLARLRVQFDQQALRLRIDLNGGVLIDETLNGGGRGRIVDAMEKYVLALNENPLSGNPGRLPLRMIGDGTTPRYQDDRAGRVTLHGRASVAAVAAAVGDSALNEQRFRSNIAIEGLDEWEELTWIGRKVRVGNLHFDVVKPKVRCLATHANPDTGERDLPILKTLTSAFAQAQPTFAIAMAVDGGGGEIRVGDAVTLIE
ncbi:MAG TPA: MOSC domain-containing protein [Burkholderiales bacterium]|nr:MOSC domain-containing protein [Burkholderiales bacterium]